MEALSNKDALTQFALFGAVLYGIAFLLKAIRQFLPDTKCTDNVFLTKSVGFWQREVRQSVGSELNQKVTPILTQQTAILSEMAKGINELVIIQRDDRVRRAAAGERD